MRHWLVVVVLGCTGEDTTPIDKPDVDTDTDTDADSDADTDTDTDSDADSDTDTAPTGDSGEVDHDGDGSPEGLDCDDTDPAVYPGAPELCDARDNDCDPATVVEDHSVFLPDVGPAVDLAPFLDAGGAGAGVWTTPSPGRVVVCGGLHHGTVVVAHDGVVVEGAGRDETRLDGVAGPAVAVDAVLVVVRDLELTGDAAEGGAIHLASGGELTLTATRLAGATADRGGGLFVGAGASATLDDVSVEGNLALAGGGIYVDDGATVEANSLSVVGNDAVDAGGGLDALLSTRIACTGCVFSDNTAQTGAGARAVAVGSFVLTSTLLSNNTAIGEGGGLLVQETAVVLTGTTFETNHATYEGGGLSARNAQVTLTDVAFDANDGSYPTSRGGGLFLSEGTIVATGTSWYDNFAEDGGGLFVTGEGQVTITDGIHGGNLARRDGGAMVLEGGRIDVVGGAWTLHNALTGGFARVRGGDLSVTDAILSGNVAEVGAVLALDGGTATVSGGALSVNQATVAGEASVVSLAGGTLTLDAAGFGTPGLDDNSLPEITTAAGGTSYDGVVTATCTSAGCTP